MEEEDIFYQFRKNCIYDYTYFIATFFICLDNKNRTTYANDARTFITNYLISGELDESISELLTNNNRKNLQELKNSNKRTLLQGDYFQVAFAGGAKKPLSLSLSLSGISSHKNNNSSPINTSGISSHINNNSSPINTSGISSYNSSPIKTSTSNSSASTVNLSRLRLNNSFNQENLFKGTNLKINSKNVFNNFNNKNYANFTDSTGVQSSMKVDNIKNPSFYFKKISSSKPLQSQRSLINECNIFNYLLTNNPNFLENYTCFVRCYKNGILLKNGGSSLHSELISKKFLFSPENIVNLNKFFEILLELHKMLITHNDLKVDNVVGFDKNDVRIIDFGLAQTYDQQFYDLNFFNLINRVFKTIFFALLKKHGFIK